MIPAPVIMTAVLYLYNVFVCGYLSVVGSPNVSTCTPLHGTSVLFLKAMFPPLQTARESRRMVIGMKESNLLADQRQLLLVPQQATQQIAARKLSQKGKHQGEQESYSVQ